MTTKEAIKILTNFNRWRRGAEIPQPDPKLIGEAIDKAVEVFKKEKEQSMHEEGLKHTNCPQCKNQFRLTWDDYQDEEGEYLPKTLIIRGCQVAEFTMFQFPVHIATTRKICKNS